MKLPYKEPMFLFTSSSLRFAAWAGWYSALGDKEKTEQWIHQAHTEWVKEIGGGRRFPFLNRYNNDMWYYIAPEVLKRLVDRFLLDVKKEVQKGKIIERKEIKGDWGNSPAFAPIKSRLRRVK